MDNKELKRIAAEVGCRIMTENGTGHELFCFHSLDSFASEIEAELSRRAQEAQAAKPVAWRVTGNYTDQPFKDESSADAYLRGLLSSDPDGGYAKSPLYATSPAPAVVQMTDEQIDRIAGCNGLYRAMTPDDQTCKSMVKRFVTDILSASVVRHG
jgi:hypothetical protein